ncbi:amino acid ABC transporter permease [Pseudomonas gingeri]|uniref:amino acid ABC transporter permease n=1 Tax=Pseudomonas gingeri TaxID=117681 RepID=UPI001C43253B|nr:amino acid ABC transporter permease [Pseudomonas gingeri]
MIAHEFAVVWEHLGDLLEGAGLTVVLSVMAGALSLLAGCGLTLLLMGRQRWLASVLRGFIELMRCTPFLLLAYLVYYGLPSFGLRLGNIQSGLLALLLYHSAYIAEILRAGWLARPREEIEAGLAFGFRGVLLARRLILPNLWTSSAPALGNQMIQVVKDTSFLTIIAVPELTSAANSLQSNYYIPFAALFSAVFFYWLICVVIELGVSMLRRKAERYQ